MDYEQEIVVTFSSAEIAARARPAILPLYRGYRAGITTRMDDSHADGLKVAEIMEESGMKGTFFLTADPPQAMSEEVAVADLNRSLEGYPASLLPGGNSVGGHTLSHPFLPALSRNAAFREIALIRAELEAASASPVNAFTYPFVYTEWRNPVPGDPSCKSDLEEMLARSGFTILSEHDYRMEGEREFQNGTFLAVDGKDSGWYTAPPDAFARRRGAEDVPLFVVSMHPWARVWGGPGYPVLRSYYERWSGDSSVWRCNHQEYAAYRLQRARASMTARRNGERLVIVLRRPDAVACGEAVPISIAFEGARAEDIRSAECQTAKAVAYDANGTAAVDVPQDPARSMPSAYGIVRPERGGAGAIDSRIGELAVSWDIEFRRGSAQANSIASGAALALRLRNVSALDAPIDDLVLRLMLPLRWKAVDAPIALPRVEAGEERVLRIELESATEDPRYAHGAACAIVQIDGISDRRFRLHAVLEYEEPLPAAALAAFPINAFLSMGPIPADAIGVNEKKIIATAVKESRIGARYILGAWNQELVWNTPEPRRAGGLDPDIAFTTGKSVAPHAASWDPALYYPHGKDLRWLLWARVRAEKPGVYALPASSAVVALFIDGRKVDPASFRLDGKERDIMIHYRPGAAEPDNPSSFAIHNYGPRVVVLDASGRRAAGVAFSRPGPVPAGGASGLKGGER